MASSGFWTQRAPKRRCAGFADDEPRVAGLAPAALRPAPEPVGNVEPGGEEVDPLDAFMAGINAEISKPSGGASGKRTAEKAFAPWEDLQADDPVASYCEAYEQAGAKRARVDGAGTGGGEGDGGANEDEEDEEDGDRRKKDVEPMPPVDHSSVTYDDVRMDFYTPHSEVATLADEEVTKLRKELGLGATGADIPHPVTSFGHLAHVVGRELMEGIRRHRFTQPTPIQSQALPVGLAGRDVIGIAKTGSGKTLAYLLPMLVHAKAQPPLERGEGPIGIVLCPTRELSVQIEQEVYKFNKLCGLRSVTLAGGLSKQEQFKEMKRGCEIAICNPGRLIDIVRLKGCTLRRVTLVVLDEADRMFDMGFGYQIRSILQNVRPKRQTLLFSATFPPKIERLAREELKQPVRITVGDMGQAAENITQTVLVLKDEDAKWDWLAGAVEGLLQKGQVMIFAKSKAACQSLQANFKDILGKPAEAIHGDLDQNERMRIMTAVRKRTVDVIIATDVAARGLDIVSIRTVVCFDVARDIETHTHRVGRTGRAGAEGDAYTLLTGDDQYKKMAAFLAEALELVGQPVSEDLRRLAMRYAPFLAAKQTGQRLADAIANAKGAGKSAGGGAAGAGKAAAGRTKGSGKGGKGAAASVAAFFET